MKYKIKRRGMLIPASLLKENFVDDCDGSIGGWLKFFPVFKTNRNAFLLTKPFLHTLDVFQILFLSILHFFYLLSVKVLGYLPISNYLMGFVLPMSTHLFDTFVATKQVLKNLSSRFLGLMRKNVKIQVQTNFNFRLFIHKNFNISNYVSFGE